MRHVMITQRHLLNELSYARSSSDAVSEYLRLPRSLAIRQEANPLAVRSVITTERQVTMKLSKKIAAVAVTAAASAGLAVGIAGSASASPAPGPGHGPSSWNCAHGIYAGYC